MMKTYYHIPLVKFSTENTSNLIIFFSVVEPNVEPSPEFDIESNKQDKDKDVDNPKIKRKPETDNPEEEEPPHPDKNK